MTKLYYTSARYLLAKVWMATMSNATLVADKQSFLDVLQEVLGVNMAVVIPSEEIIAEKRGVECFYFHKGLRKPIIADPLVQLLRAFAVEGEDAHDAYDRLFPILQRLVGGGSRKLMIHVHAKLDQERLVVQFITP